MTRSPLTAPLHASIRRYQTTLIGRSLVLAVLGGGILVVAAWRVHRARPDAPGWLAWLPPAAAVIGIAALGWWVRRRWLSRGAAVRALDEAMGLGQRLLTAAEFEAVSEPPTLYPLLIEDTVRRLSESPHRLPRLGGRTTFALAALLLLLLLWPGAGRGPIRLARGTDRTQSPQPSQEPPSPSESPQSQPPRQDRHEEHSQPNQQQAQGQQSPSPGSDQAQPPQGHQGSSSAQRPNQSSSASGRDQQPQGGSPQPQDGAQTAKDSAQSGDRPSPAQGRPSDKTAQQGAGANQQTHQPQPAKQAEDAGTPQGESAAEQARRAESNKQAKGGQSGSPADQGSARQPAQDQQAGGASQQRQGQLSASGVSENRGGGTGGASGNQEAMRADIQGLLKDLQGELQQIQEQLAAKAMDQPQPNAGTGTDPNLFGAPEALPPAAGAARPVRLETDNAPSASTRPGGGVGKPSGEIAKTAPQMPAGEAALAEQPLDETAGQRRAVPPEYQSVFERLHRHPVDATQSATP